MSAALTRIRGFRYLMPTRMTSAETTHTPTFYVNREGLTTLQDELNRLAQSGGCRLDQFVAACQLIVTLHKHVPIDGFSIALTQVLALAADQDFTDVQLRAGLTLLLQVLQLESVPIDEFTVANEE